MIAGGGSASWFFYPDFSGANPYQSLLAEALAPHGWTVRPGDIAVASADRAARIVFHIGWEQSVYVQARDEAGAANLVNHFFDALDVFRARGGTVVWTLHNAHPHEDRFPALNLNVQRRLAGRADVAHVHNHAGALHARAVGVPDGRIVRAANPSCIEAYPDDVTGAQARRYFGFADQATVFAFFGAIRPYKGLSRLMRAFETISPAVLDMHLLIAGRSGEPSSQRVRVASPNVHLALREIADAEVQYVMHAADCLVLPYEAILTSGALALAQAFGRPVIVPDLPSMLEEVEDGRNGFVFRAGDDDALADALWRASEAIAAVRGPMREAARAAVRGRDAVALAGALAASVDRVLVRTHAA